MSDTPAPPGQPAEPTGAHRIAAERQRQIDAEGWTPEHDREHVHGELARAAVGYALAASAPVDAGRHGHEIWPQHWHFKHADPVRMLEKAGALIAAEIDRLLAGRGAADGGEPR